MIWISKCCLSKAVLVSAVTMVPALIAIADPAGPVSAAPPLTMARFYMVDSNGRSVSDRSIPVQTTEQYQRSVKPVQMKSDRRPRHSANKAREKSDSRDLVQPRSNETTAWQCERHGFFFTADGRCIRPVIHVKQAPPPTSSRSPIRRKLVRNSTDY